MQFNKLFALIAFIVTVNLVSQEHDYRDADKLFNQEKWEEAAMIYKQLADSNPYNGYFWSNYAYCLYSTKQYGKAIETYEKSIEVGYGVPESMYNIACCYSLMNKPEEAITWIEKSANFKFRNLERSILNDGDFNPIRNNESFKKIIMPSGDFFKNRIDGWKTDIKFMQKRMQQSHYNLYANITKDNWDNMFRNLLDRVEVLDDSQIYTEMLKITAKVGDGHTTIFLPSGEKVKANVLPIQFFYFEDGLYITLATTDYKNLAGKKVIKIGNTETENLFKRMREVVSYDNEFNFMSFCMHSIINNDILYGLGIAKSRDETEITIEGNEKIIVKSSPAEANIFHNPLFRRDWIKGRDTLNTPLYLKNTANIYWYEYLPERKLVYMQFNAVANKEDEPLSEFVKKMFEFINGNDVEYFVLDIRLNGGGNNFINKPLVQGIIKCDKINQKGKFFTITGRNTFSAAMNLTNNLENQTNVIFAGEPTGSRPNFVGETNIITLPYSGLQVSCSSRYWQGNLSDDYRKWIAPQIGVKYFYNDYKNGIDPAMDAIVKFIKKNPD